jgi:riboflavin biosynthesis pyrimidine reductase
MMVEGGAGLITSFLRARLVDRMVVTLAPKILGRGIEAVGDLRIDDLAGAIRLASVVYERYGDDIVIDGKVDAG